MIITITKSPFEEDYENEEDAPPWSHEEDGFCNWVWEVLLECEEGAVLTLDEAVEVARDWGFSVEVTT